MRIKATIVAYAFSVQCFENATIVAYAGLRVKHTTSYTEVNNSHFALLLANLLSEYSLACWLISAMCCLCASRLVSSI